ncbi:MAG TPA: hypothetical protein VNO26_06630 [Candidatus Limnocylindria bacterium]|nr:hypothetical protein [Candidatus Limnocylindria bacterium]
MSRPSRSARLGPFALLAVLALAAPARATDLAALLAALDENARFDPPVRAEVTFETKRPTGPVTSTLVLYGRGRTVRVELPDGRRGLAKPGKCVFAPAGGVPKAVREQVVGSSAFLLEDLVPFTASWLRVPLISDEGPAGVVVAGEPRQPSPYVLVALTVPPDRPLVTAAKYYRWEVTNLTKMTRVTETAEVGGHWRPVVMDFQDLGPGGDTTTITFNWHEHPDLPAVAFTPSGLATPIPR